MREIERSSAFKKDYRREAKGRHRNTLEAEFSFVLSALANDQQLEPRHRDHNLGGAWSGYRECHIRPNLLLIYGKTGEDLLRLVRLGSHSELFD